VALVLGELHQVVLEDLAESRMALRGVRSSWLMLARNRSSAGRSRDVGVAISSSRVRSADLLDLPLLVA